MGKIDRARICKLTICLILLTLALSIPFKIGYAITGSTLIHNLKWSGTALWTNNTIQGFPTLSITWSSVSSNVTQDFYTNFSLYGENDFGFAYEHKFSINITSLGVSDIAVLQTMPTGSFLGIRLMYFNATCYLMNHIIYGNVQSGPTLELSMAYDIIRKVLFYTTGGPTYYQDILVYTYGHSGDSSYLIFNYTVGYSNAGMSMSGPMDLYLGNGGVGGSVWNQAIIKSDPSVTLTVETFNIATNSLMSDITYLIDGVSYSGNTSASSLAGNHTFDFPIAQNINASTNWVFLNATANGVLQSGASFTYDVQIATTVIAYYQNEPVQALSGGWIMFGLGIMGLILIGSSWLVGKYYWDQGDIGNGLMYWFILIIMGIGLCVAWIGG